jgi:two-component system sensor histidine kinase/response regulator
MRSFIKQNLSRLRPTIHNSIRKIKLLTNKKEAEKTFHRSEYRHQRLYVDRLDVIGHHQVVEALRESKQIIEGILNAIPARVFWKDSNLNYLGCNTIFALDAGFTKPDDIIGKNDYQMGWHDQADLYRNDDREVVNTGVPKLNIEETQSTPTGNTKVILTNKVPLRNSKGEIRGILGTYIDITQRKHAEDLLRQSYELNETLLKTIPFGMNIIDENGIILFQNDNFKKLFGDDAIGKKCWELYKTDKIQCTTCPLKNGITVGETNTYESHGFHGERIIEIKHTGMYYHGKKAMLEIFQDITERKENEAALISARERAEQSDKLKTAFLNNISHEIRTPLNAIVGFAAIIGNSVVSENKRKELSDIIQTSSDQLLSVISRIMSLASLEAGQEFVTESKTDINEILVNVYEQFMIAPYSTETILSYHPEIPDKPVYIYTDPLKLTHILFNLVENALKFTHQGQVRFGYTFAGNLIQFFVEDTGIGIAREMQTIIFERFRQVDESVTRNYGGMGLGLSLSKAYIELLGGKLMLTSEPGKGSVFTFTLPCKQLIPPKSEINTNQFTIKVTPGKTILVAEDEPNNFLLIKEILTDLQFKVIWVKNGLEAVDFCSTGNFPDLILMDIKMPLMDGIEATRKIKILNPQIPVIALTAQTMGEVKKHIFASGCDAYIEKPVNFKLLIGKLAEYFAN